MLKFYYTVLNMKLLRFSPTSAVGFGLPLQSGYKYNFSSQLNLIEDTFYSCTCAKLQACFNDSTLYYVIFIADYNV